MCVVVVVKVGVQIVHAFPVGSVGKQQVAATWDRRLVVEASWLLNLGVD